MCNMTQKVNTNKKNIFPMYTFVSSRALRGCVCTCCGNCFHLAGWDLQDANILTKKIKMQQFLEFLMNFLH